MKTQEIDVTDLDIKITLHAGGSFECTMKTEVTGYVPGLGVMTKNARHAWEQKKLSPAGITIHLDDGETLHTWSSIKNVTVKEVRRKEVWKIIRNPLFSLGKSYRVEFVSSTEKV